MIQHTCQLSGGPFQLCNDGQNQLMFVGETTELVCFSTVVVALAVLRSCIHGMLVAGQCLQPAQSGACTACNWWHLITSNSF
jgi:hypothetical protein